MISKVHRLGHDSFRVDDEVTVFIDPWKLSPGGPSADVILVTHDHYDHFSPDDIALVAAESTVVVGPASVTGQLEGFAALTVQPGDVVTVAGLELTALPAYNVDKFREPGVPFHPREAGYVGYLIDFGGWRLYHAGDTDVIPEMRGLACDVALLPVGGTYTMTPEEAAHACTLIEASVVVPMHYGDIVGTEADAERLSRLVGASVRLLPLER